MAVKCLESKSEDTIYPFLDKIIDKVKASKYNSVIEKGVDLSVIQLQLIEAVKEESENKWIKRTIVYVLKRLKIEDLDLKKDDFDVYEVIKLKTIKGLKDVSEPSKKSYGLL